MKSPTNGRGLAQRSAMAFIVGVLAISGCAEVQEESGPGPVGPIGPVGTEVGEAGSGNVVREVRDIAGTSRVIFASEGEVEIVTGTESSLTVEADDNLLTHFRATVEEDILRITTAEGVDIAPSRAPRFLIAMPQLSEVELSGVGRIDVESARSDIFGLTLTGVGDIVLRDVDVGLLLYDLTGVGSVTIEGSATDQRGVVAGQSRYLAGALESERAMLQASGGGHAEVSVSETLDLSAIDTATVEYHGSPAVTQEVGDLATVSALDE